MSHLFQADLVRLLCSCGLLRPITAIYFCRHCLKLRCANCVSHEMDMLYCPSCLENMPSPEARLKKNRCGNCFDCPSCGQSLSTRASSVQCPDPEQPQRSVQRKLYYLACTGCRWTSRDVAIPDQTVASGGWPEREAPQQERIMALLEHYRAVAQRDKLDRERKRLAAARLKSTSTFLRGAGPDASLGPGVSASVASVRKSLAAMSTYVLKGEPPLHSTLTPAEPVDDVDGLPDDIFTANVPLTQVCSLSQRLWSPEHQPPLTSQLYPLHKHMLVKRSLRCRHCEHNLSKPEYNPSSIKFKIQLAAYYHVPEVRLVSAVPLLAGVESCVQVSLCNPTPHLMTVALLPFVPDTEEEDAAPSSSAVPLGRMVCVPRERCVPQLSLAVLPQGQVLLAARDDTAEWDEQDPHVFRDDPQVVAWRRSNKVGVNLYVTPAADLTPGDPVTVGFVLRYDYTNTVIATTAGMSSLSGGPGSLGQSGPTSIGSGPPSGPASLGPTAESRTVTLNVPVLVTAGRVGDARESSA